MEILEIILLIILAGHAVILGILALLARMPYPRRECSEPAELTVIIKARDEEKNLSACLDSIVQLEGFKTERLVLVDDGSRDTTRAVMDEYAARASATVIAIHHEWTNQAQRDADRKTVLSNPRFFAHDAVIYLPSLENRQRAVAAAMEHVQPGAVALTDGDCTVKPGWLKSTRNMLECFALVCGYVDFAPGKRLLFDRIVAVEALLLQVASAAAYRLGKPGGAMGANLAYRTDAYRELGGYPALGASLTEDAQMAIAVATKHPVAYNTDPTAVVEHHDRLGVWRFIRQRAFWLLGGARLSIFWVITPLFLAMDALAPWLALILVLTGIIPVWFIVLGFGERLLGDLACWAAFHRLDTRVKPWDFVAAWLFQAIYLPLLPVLILPGFRRLIEGKPREA
jgi:cellulose synthase/poly-beta-1,6-N-acetylglucosamine synthase-like glycosyltransferase